ncbi:MAG: DPP IV N-terminal domain-containing protein [Fimbriimonadaceae bacterium]|nr:DPP IV N-terminal domain-containing protein [Fimbriimonadaceae bacterium]
MSKNSIASQARLKPGSLRMKPASLLALCLFQLTALAVGQNNANWELANRFSPQNINLYVGSTSVNPRFIGKTDNFWYTWRDGDGVTFHFVNPKAKIKRPLFDHVKMAELLSEAVKKPYEASNLPFTDVEFQEKTNAIRFVVERVRYEYDLDKETLTKIEDIKPEPRPLPNFRNYSPDKKACVYAMDHNLYYVEIVDNKEQEPIQLTKDGEEYYSFGSATGSGSQRVIGGTPPPVPNEKRVRANVSWSPDSNWFYIMRSDSRKVKPLWLVNNIADPRPTLLEYKYAMPGDPDITIQEFFVFNRADKQLKKMDISKFKDQSIIRPDWSDKSDKIRMLRRDRLQRNADLVDLDPATGKITELLTESVENAFLEVFEMTSNMRYLVNDKMGEDFVWWSERSGWGHLYLYGPDGKLKQQLTRGAFRVESVVDVDKEKNMVWFTAVGRERGENPYYTHLYRVNLDGTGLTLLDAGDANHSSRLSTSKQYIVDNATRVDMAPTAVVRDSKGSVIMALEQTDLSRLMETGWKMPETFVVKAADATTNIYGNIWKPFDFNPSKKYPIILNVYPGPQTESVTANFSAYSSTQQLAQLGFIVIQIGNRGGNPSRSNAYHSFGYYNLRDYGLADKKAGVEQLAAKYSWIDINRIGIYGHSGGGFMTAAAMMLPPYNDFFKVGVSSAGNHDNNIYNWNWSEQHHGLREVAVNQQTGGTGGQGTGQGGGRGGRGGGGGGRGGGGDEFGPSPDEVFWEQFFDAPAIETKFEIKVPTTQELAPNLRGKLLIVHGDMDNNVHPAGSIRLANELIKANKRFDFMLMPGQAHGFGPYSGYFQQMSWEYFAQHLLGDDYSRNAEMKDKGGR